jgi:methylenetetrahydrofolate dehydrogenase (NADP+)/methenyltetrahydrofolate cyclohydrolase
MILIDGKETANKIKDQIAKEVAQLQSEGKKTPHLAAILVGSDGASETYVNSKVKNCARVGFNSTLVNFSDDVSEKELLSKIEELNNNDEIDGYIVQLPLPNHIDEKKVTEAIDPKKDVDGFHPENLGKMVLGLPCFLPATPYGIMMMLENYGIETAGKNCVVMGRSHIVGSPMSILMSRKANPGNATVTMVHSRTVNLRYYTKQADILIAAIGKPEFVTADMVKEGATVIDVGIHRLPSDKTKSGFKLFGDVKFDEVSGKCHAISPVPGGVGPMTIVGLLKNTLEAVKMKY